MNAYFWIYKQNKLWLLNNVNKNEWNDNLTFTLIIDLQVVIKIQGRYKNLN